MLRMLRRSRALLAAATLISIMSFLGQHGIAIAQPAGTPMCRFSGVRMNPAEPKKYETYVGKGKSLDIVVTNSSGQPTDSFSDPPYIIRKRDGNGECGIEGGNWPANGLYLTSDDRTLLALEFSGSSSTLVIYDTETCMRKQAFDVSSASWNVTGDTITIAAHVADERRRIRVPKKTMKLDANCVLK